jgi:hypothetical protein
MPCYTERELEQLLSGERSERNEEMWGHLYRCDQCRHLFFFLQQWEYQFSLLRKDSNNVAARMVLKPVQQAEEDVHRAYRLAAQGKQPAGPIVVHSFSSAEKGVVGRVLYDKQDRHRRLYLISEDMEQVKGAKVRLEGCELEGITDLEGKIDFGLQSEPVCTSVHIQSPQATFDLPPHGIEDFLTSQSHSFQIRNDRHDEIEIVIDREQEQMRYRLSLKRLQGQPPQSALQMVVLTNKRTIQTDTRQGVSVIETTEPERLLKVHIY